MVLIPLTKLSILLIKFRVVLTGVLRVNFIQFCLEMNTILHLVFYFLFMYYEDKERY